MPDSDVVTREELETEAARLAGELEPGEEATIIALIGDLGAGKTTFAQAFAHALGVREHITSPTFVIEKRYPLSGQKFRTLVHIDAYRLDTPEELMKLGWNGTTSDPENIVLVEWADKIRPILPDHAYEISLTFRDEDTRQLTYGT